MEKLVESDESIARVSAVHEAGHAVGLMLLGLAKTIHLIVMMREPGSTAALYHHALEHSQLMYDPTMAADPSMRTAALGTMLVSLLGPAAERRFDGSLRWFERLFDSCGGLHKVEDRKSDICDARALARAMGGNYRRAVFLIYQIASGCDELVAEDRVWTTIEAVADVLPYGETIPGQAILPVMKKVWTEDDYRMPIMALGSKWQRRLAPRIPLRPDPLKPQPSHNSA